MPSCDGSNCGACNCNCTTKTEYIHMDKKEREKYEERIKRLESEILESRKLNEELTKRLLENKEV